MFYAQQCASRHRFLRSAEPDIHLQSRAPKSLHRRLSLCSLPVPKQFVESLGRVISFAQSATCRTWQSAHFVHPVDFGSILCCRNPAFFSRNEVRALIVHLVVRYGPERGLIEARDAFNTTFDQMKPILENMEKAKGHPPQ